jgi:hypothetical protein
MKGLSSLTDYKTPDRSGGDANGGILLKIRQK